ncbi:MAG: ABC transporter permease [Rhodospirillales bacterium]|nr:ABC transporter permease [Rhodospirillales bacterium]
MKTGALAETGKTTAAMPRLKHRRRVLPLDYARRRSLQALIGAIFVFLYFPIVALVAFSFNDSKRNVTWQGFTFDYYVKAFNNASLHEAFTNSMIIGSTSTLVSTVLGAMLGLGLYRFRFPAKGLVDGWVSLPIVIPEVCMGVAMLAFFAEMNISLGLFTITVSHIAFSTPFVAVVIRARMAGFDESLEEASRDLGANQWQTFWNVTFPYMIPGVVAGALLAFTLSLDDFVITFFTSGPGSTTFPIKIYSMVRFSVTPEVNAASTVLIVLTLTLTVTAMLIQGRSGKEMAAK